MNSKFREPIIVFGLILPILGIAALIFGVLKYNGSINEKYKKKEIAYNAQKNTETQTRALKARVETFRDRKSYWESLLKKRSDVSSVTTLLREIGQEHDSREFRQTDFKFVNRETGIGSAGKQSSVSFELALDGTYRALQESLLTLESTMPHLSLNRMTISPRSERNALQIELSYSAWTN